jgi:MFS transporter, ACS family, tartrate transporter
MSKVITLAAINFCYIVGNQGIGIWVPQLVKSFGLTNLQVGFVAMSCFFLIASLLIIALHFMACIHEVSLPVDQAAGQ